MNSFTFEAIGTSWKIDIIDSISSTQLEKIQKAIQDRIEVYDRTYSRFRSDSVITQLAKKSGKYILPDDAKELFTLYHTLYTLTDGTFTPLIGDVLIDAGYDAQYSLQTKKLHRPHKWEDMFHYTHPALTIKKPTMLDFGAAGKGYLVDIVAQILIKDGITSFCVDGSGDIYYQHKDNAPLQVGLEHPENPKQVIGVASITKGSLCGSAGNKRRWGGFHHIINPHTLTSPEDILAIWVVAADAFHADALTTCLFFVTPEKMQKYFSFEYVIVKSDYTLDKSEHFPGEFFYK